MNFNSSNQRQGYGMNSNSNNFLNQTNRFNMGTSNNQQQYGNNFNSNQQNRFGFNNQSQNNAGNQNQQNNNPKHTFYLKKQNHAIKDLYSYGQNFKYKQLDITTDSNSYKKDIGRFYNICTEPEFENCSLQMIRLHDMIAQMTGKPKENPEWISQQIFQQNSQNYKLIKNVQVGGQQQSTFNSNFNSFNQNKQSNGFQQQNSNFGFQNTQTKSSFNSFGQFQSNNNNNQNNQFSNFNRNQQNSFNNQNQNQFQNQQNTQFQSNNQQFGQFNQQSNSNNQFGNQSFNQSNNFNTFKPNNNFGNTNSNFNSGFNSQNNNNNNFNSNFNNFQNKQNQSKIKFNLSSNNQTNFQQNQSQLNFQRFGQQNQNQNQSGNMFSQNKPFQQNQMIGSNMQQNPQNYLQEQLGKGLFSNCFQNYNNDPAYMDKFIEIQKKPLFGMGLESGANLNSQQNQTIAFGAKPSSFLQQKSQKNIQIQDIDLLKEKSEHSFNQVKLNNKSGLINENFRKSDQSLLSLSSEKKKGFSEEFLKINLRSGPLFEKENYQLSNNFQGAPFMSTVNILYQPQFTLQEQRYLEKMELKERSLYALNKQNDQSCLFKNSSSQRSIYQPQINNQFKEKTINPTTPRINNYFSAQSINPFSAFQEKSIENKSLKSLNHSKNQFLNSQIKQAVIEPSTKKPNDIFELTIKAYDQNEEEKELEIKIHKSNDVIDVYKRVQKWFTQEIIKENIYLYSKESFDFTLVFRNQVLDINKKLKEYDIENGSCIQLLYVQPKLRKEDVQSNISNEDDEKDSKSLEFVISLDDEIKKPYFPKKPKEGYYTDPKFEILMQMSEQELQSLKYFKIWNEFGSISFSRKNGKGIDITYVDLYNEVEINKRDVRVYEIYDNDENSSINIDKLKPRIGQKLNIPAMIVLNEVRPTKGKTIDQFEQFLKDVLQKQAISSEVSVPEFISYDKETFQWEFKVPHF